ncbi:hypothetical protein [Paracoccus sp. DMF]|uniref:hypothetical protein n=1 Tax=Paracoccus sp. DMF TaxID=400837 RepID=UPI0011027677|nr:hypothetical protein [Paracoccus sp. DMF]MCV2448897.1 hypothetical protein [Paracoccus sp. DMF]
MPRTLPFLTFGQSYVEQGYGRNASLSPFNVALRRAIATSAAAISTRLGVTVAAGDMTQLRQRGIGGSAILQANDGGNGYWVANGNSAGPLLTAAVAAIGTYADKPQFAIWSHGEADAQSSSLNVANVQTAITTRLFPDIRSACDSGAPNSVLIFVDILGFRYIADQDRENALRDMMLNVISSQTNVFRGSEKYAVELDSTFHPTQIGYQTLGAHTGRRVAELIATGNVLEAPAIATAGRSGTSVTININVPSGKTLVKPVHPAHFGLYDAGGVRLPYSASWSGDSVTLTCPSVPVSLRYPDREVFFDASRIVRLADPADPIFPGEPGLPLQSRLPIVF